MRTRKAWKGCAAGVVGGLAATLVMTGFQSVWSAAASHSNGNGAGSQPASGNSARQADSGEAQNSEQNSGKDNPTEKVAEKLVGVSGRQLSLQGKKKGGAVVHYAFGTLMGALYGTAREFAPRKYRREAIGSGLLWGSALFTVADEIALPTLELTDRPTDTPLSMHLFGLVSHLVYGATAGVVTRSVREKL